MSQFIFVKKEQQTNKHALLAIMLCLLLLFSSFSFVFAEGEGDISSGLLPVYPYDSSPYYLNMRNYPLAFVTVNNNSFYYCAFNCSSNDSAVYIGYINSSSSICFATFDSTAKVAQGRSDSSNVAEFSLVTFDETTSLHYYNINDTFTTNELYIPDFDTVSSFLSYVANGGNTGGGWSGQATVSVEAGCVAYILVDGGTATLTTTFPELSKLSRPLWVSGSTYSFENDLPSSGKVFSSTSGTLIDWLIPANAKTDLLGRSYQGGRPLSDLPSGQYLVVYNPVYRGYDDKGVGIMSPTIYVSLSNYGAVRQFRLTASYNGGLIESTSDDGYSSWFDSIGEEELDANGNPIYVEHLANGTTQTAISIPSGGGNIVINGDNADNSIGGLLERLLSLLTAPIKYIERLYNSAVQFFDYLSSLWGWLPVEVTSIIGAALAVLVVIGVVKFLWK